MSVKQFSAHYDPLEDRILLRFNTRDGDLYQFWVTRLIAKSLNLHAQSALEQSAAAEHTERSSKIIVEFQKEGLKKQLSFQESFEGGSQMPLGSESILITQVTMEKAGESVVIAFALTTNQILRFSLLPMQVQVFTLLIERLVQQADWRLIEMLPESESIGNQEKDSGVQLH
jgi:hypothetical protein